MGIEPGLLFGIGLAYLLSLFGVAWIADRGWLPERLIRHPLVYILSLGVFAGAWALFGAVDLAYRYGYGFLSYYFGAACLFLFAPLLIAPLARLCRLYQLHSLADLLAFRFRSRWIGMAVTLGLLLAMLPMLAMQIQAVADAVHLLGPQETGTAQAALPRDTLALLFCLTIAVFTVLFGSRHLGGSERHNGLVAAIAVESLFKLLVLFVVAAAAISHIFGGWQGLEDWLAAQPDLLQQLRQPRNNVTSHTLMLVFFASTLVMPHMFHMAFAENPGARALKQASWGAPLLFLLMSLPILPILWAGLASGSTLPVEYFIFAVGLELDSPTLSLLAFLGGLSAGSGAIIVITLSLATMILNHLILPFYRLRGHSDLYRRVLWTRRVLIVAILAGAYLFFLLVRQDHRLLGLGMVALIATLQFVPGIVATLYWPRANRRGFLAGLVTGYTLWYFSLLLPFVTGNEASGLAATLSALLFDSSQWSAAAMSSLGANIVVLAVVSLLTATDAEEQHAAAICATDQLNRPARLALALHSPQEFRRRLSQPLGENTAQREVNRALQTLGLDDSERRPYALRRLRDQIEANLSGLLGPATAHYLVEHHLPYDLPDSNSGGEDIQFIEQRLEQYRDNLSGLAAELDKLRRHHRRTLEELPIGLAALGSDGEILMWNRAMERVTGIAAPRVIGAHLDTLDEPWRQVLTGFLHRPGTASHKEALSINGDTRWLVLHKAKDEADSRRQHILVAEDITETERLENRLIHSERLASIGRLAAGVAHEIGNPVTGIACLAQNLREDRPETDVRQATDDILSQTRRIDRILQSLLHFAHSGKPQADDFSQAVNLRYCVDEALHLLTLNRDARTIRWKNTCSPDLYLRGDPQQLQQVFINLLGNARDASPDNGRILVQAHREGAQVHIRVEDEGHGIPANLQSQIFEPFFTTKEPGQGTGLGMALVFRIVENHQGQIRIHSPVSRERGTAILLTLPAADTAASSDHTPTDTENQA